MEWIEDIEEKYNKPMELHCSIVYLYILKIQVMSMR
jgi:hypothetical protein